MTDNHTLRSFPQTALHLHNAQTDSCTILLPCHGGYDCTAVVRTCFLLAEQLYQQLLTGEPQLRRFRQEPVTLHEQHG